MNTEQIRQRAPATIRARLDELFQTLSREACKKQVPVLGERVSTDSNKTVKQMQRNDIIEEATSGSTPNTIIFPIPEYDKERNRIIGWPLWANGWTYEWDHTTAKQSDAVELTRMVHSASWAATFDLKASFFQVGLEPNQRQAFVFTVRGRVFCFKRLVMGYTASAEIMQLLTQAIAQIVTSSIGGHPRFIVHVDNVLFLGSFDEIQAVIKAMNEAADTFSVTFSETQLIPLQRVKFFGMILDFCAKTVTMADKAVTKFERMTDFLLGERTKTQGHIVNLSILGGQWPLLSIVATITFWSRTMWRGAYFSQGMIASKYSEMNTIRAITSAACAGETVFKCNMGAFTRLIRWIHDIPRHITIPASTRRCRIITDASITGGGAIIQFDGESPRHLAFPWPTPVSPKDIAIYELRAIAIAVAWVGIQMIPTEVYLYTDSQPGLGALQKGYSPVKAINEEVRRILRHATANNMFITHITYIPTYENPADELSHVKHVISHSH